MKIKDKQYFWVKIIFGILVLVFAVVLFFDRRATELLFNAHWPRLVWALVFTFVSLFFATYGFYYICRELKLKIDPKKLFLIGFATIAINDLVTSGGTAGFSVRILLLRNKEISGKQILSASLFHSYFNLLVAVFFLPFSIFFLSLADGFPSGTKAALSVFSFLLIALFIFASWIFMSSRARARVLGIFARLLRRLTKKDRTASFSVFNEVLDQGAAVIKKKKVIFILFAVTFLDWLFSFSALAACFWALGISLPLGLILSGFFIGIIAGFVSIIPGGLGVQEGSMAGIFALLGMPFSQAIIAAVLFRLVYYVIPFVPGIFFYANEMRSLRAEKIKAENNLIIPDYYA
jgi:glycosyltransferase 2 family protein